MHRTKAIPYICSLLIFLVTLVTGPAWSQTSATWLPEFNPGQSVYVDPKLSSDRIAPVDFSKLESLIKTEQRAHGLQIYVIATKQGSDLSGSGMAVRKLEELQLKWAGNPNFSKEKYLIILWVRRADDANRSSIAGVGGNWLREMGMGTAYFNDDNTGPLRTSLLRKYFPQDPASGFVAVAQSVNADISAKVWDAQKPYYFGGGIVILILIGAFLVLLVRFSRAKAQAASLLKEWNSTLDASNVVYLAFRKSYIGFLGSHTDWKSKFKGITLTTYTKAIKETGTYAARSKKANDLYDEAKRAFDSCRFPSVGGFSKVRELLVEKTAVITGDVLPMEDVTLFGGLIEKSEYKPKELLDSMDALFQSINKALASITKSFDGAGQNKLDIEGYMQSVDAGKAEIEACGLTFAPYTARVASIKERQSAFLAILTSDPMAAFQGSEDVEADAKSLSEDLVRAKSMKISFQEVSAGIDQATSTADALRGQSLVYKYPLIDGETAPVEQAATLLLKEDDGNPDSLIAKARSHLDQAASLLLEAKLNEAQAAKEAALAATDEANARVKKWLEAKQWIENKGVAELRATHASLSSELPGALRALSEMQENFRNTETDVHYLNVGNAETEAQTVSPRTLTNAKDAYDQQNYLSARSLLEAQIQAVAKARRDLQGVHTRLAQLNKMKSDAKSAIDQSLSSLKSLAQKVTRTAFTTSQKTADRFAAVQSLVNALHGSSQARLPDWPEIHNRALEAQKEVAAVDRACDADESAYTAAKTAVGNLESAVRTANGALENDYVRKAARTAASEAQGALRTLSTSIRNARSNWQQIKKDADEAKEKADNAAEKAAADVSSAREANSAISSANTHINTISTRSYGHSISADTAIAKRKLGEARTQLSNGNYEEAKETADGAYEAATKADRDAKSDAEAKDEAERQSSIVIVPLPGNQGGGFSGGGFSGSGPSSSQPDYTPPSTPTYTPPSDPDPPANTGVGGNETRDTGVGGRDL